MTMEGEPSTPSPVQTRFKPGLGGVSEAGKDLGGKSLLVQEPKNGFDDGFSPVAAHPPMNRASAAKRAGRTVWEINEVTTRVGKVLRKGAEQVRWQRQSAGISYYACG